MVVVLVMVASWLKQHVFVSGCPPAGWLVSPTVHTLSASSGHCGHDDLCRMLGVARHRDIQQSKKGDNVN